MNLTIPPTVVPALRDGLVFDIHGQTDQANSAIKRVAPDYGHAEIVAALERAGGTVALLDTLGWDRGSKPPSGVSIDVGSHRAALLRGLKEAADSQANAAEDDQQTPEYRTGAQEQARALAVLKEQVEETS